MARATCRTGSRSVCPSSGARPTACRLSRTQEATSVWTANVRSRTADMSVGPATQLLNEGEEVFRTALEFLSQHPDERGRLGQLAGNRFTGLLGSFARAMGRLDQVIRSVRIRRSGQDTRMVRVRHFRAGLEPTRHEAYSLLVESARVMSLIHKIRSITGPGATPTGAEGREHGQPPPSSRHTGLSFDPQKRFFRRATGAWARLSPPW